MYSKTQSDLTKQADYSINDRPDMTKKRYVYGVK